MPRPLSHLGVVSLVAVALCVLAFVNGVATTGDLDWPFDLDHFRDVAQAQTIRDGGWLRDPYYRGEMAWYNPLVPGLVAALSWVADVPAHLVHTRAGAYLNLLPGLALLLLARSFFGWPTALLALTGFLFVREEPSWAAPAYSPWLFSGSFAQAFFYLSLAAYLRAARRNTWLSHMAVGLLVGLTFLAHAAPALMAGALISVGAVFQARTGDAAQRPIRREARNWSFVVLVALVVATPFLWTILGHYHLAVVNPFPATWLPPSLGLENWRAFASANLAPSLFNAFFLVGGVRVALTPGFRLERTLLVAWLFVSLSAFVYSAYICQLAAEAGIALPNPVPAHHFLFSFRVLQVLLWAYGVAWLASLPAWLARRSGAPTAAEGWAAPARELGIVCVLAGTIAAASFAGQRDREDFEPARARARIINAGPESAELHEWVRNETQSDDVFLVSENTGMGLIGPAGRRVVVVDRFFSNPYVDWESREDDREEMWESLARGACGRFQELARLRSVTYVLVIVGLSPQLHPCGLEPAFRSGRFAILRVTG